MSKGREPSQFWDSPPEVITRDLLARHERIGGGYWLAIAITGILFLIGIVGLIVRLQGGFDDRAAWGYYAATFAFIFAIVQGAPMVAVVLVFTKAHLRRPLSNPSLLFAAAGPLVFLLFLPILSLIPPLQGRNNLWMGMAIGGAPYTWDTLAVGFLALCGVALFWLISRPDLDTVHQLGPEGWRKSLAGRLAAHWRGNQSRWRRLSIWMVLLGGLYFVAFVLTNTLVSIDAAMSLVPGWRSGLFAPYHILTSFEAGVAATILAMGILRLTGFRSYLLFDQFWGLGKVLFALALLGIYFTFADFITLWYGRIPQEQTILQLTVFGPYLPVFLAAFFLSFFAPFLAMMWNRVRQSILGPTLVAAGVLAGLFLDRIRLYVAAYAAAQVSTEPILQTPPVRLPDGADFMIMIGLPAGVILIYLLASKLVPAVSIWQIKELLLLRKTRRYLRTSVTTMAKPE
ncbi:MAG: hypothetical protein Q8R28_07260 [Dehalococcoidia bacterium]|nr:hypothetical protein [Dehalococcoidia bacterium]